MNVTFQQDIELAFGATKNSDIYTRLGIKTEAARQFIIVALANALLMDRKQMDYGPKNISTFGTPGIIVRTNDKFERLKNLIDVKGGKRKEAQNESVIDSFRDMSNYSIIALMVELGTWPEE